VLKRQKGKGFVAKCLELPGCLSEGRTEEEALTNVEDAIKLYLKDVKKEAKGEEGKGCTGLSLVVQKNQAPTISWRDLIND
jgi:predicted RNase H-like HicB family nuclease